MTGLSTPILDTCAGTPAANVHIELFRDGNERKQCQSHSDSCTDEPLIASGELVTGTCELHFTPATVTEKKQHLRRNFGIDVVDRHFHVPQLLSSFGYTTYRGS